MAKKTVATLQEKGKTFTKVVRMYKSDKTGAYAFEEKMVPADQVKDYLSKK